MVPISLLYELGALELKFIVKLISNTAEISKKDNIHSVTHSFVHSKSLSDHLQALGKNTVADVEIGFP